MLYRTTTTDFYYIMQYATLYFFLLKISTILRKMSRNYLGNSILQNEDEHKGKKLFCRNKALIVSHSKRFLAWFNSTTWNIISKIWCVVWTRKTGRENYLSQRSILQTYRRLFYLFMRCFMAIVLFWRVYFISTFYFVHFISALV